VWLPEGSPADAKQGERHAPALVAETSLALFDRMQSKLLGVPAPCPFEILGSQPGRHGRPGQWAVTGPRVRRREFDDLDQVAIGIEQRGSASWTAKY
jgi:hypothetical protein